MSKEKWLGVVNNANGQIVELRKSAPKVLGGFGELAKQATRNGELSPKTKELIALAIGIAVRCDGCLAFHAKAAADEGATRQEVVETIGVAIYMGGGPSMIYGAEALDAFDAFAEKG